MPCNIMPGTLKERWGSEGKESGFGVRITEIAAARSKERLRERLGEVTEVTRGGPARIIVGK